MPLWKRFRVSSWIKTWMEMSSSKDVSQTLWSNSRFSRQWPKKPGGGRADRDETHEYIWKLTSGPAWCSEDRAKWHSYTFRKIRIWKESTKCADKIWVKTVGSSRIELGIHDETENKDKELQQRTNTRTIFIKESYSWAENAFASL